MSAGKWQKEIPAVDGRYWVATQDGLSAGLATVIHDPRGRRLMAGLTAQSVWAGWWYSEPVSEPKPPPADIWGRAKTFSWSESDPVGECT